MKNIKYQYWLLSIKNIATIHKLSIFLYSIFFIFLISPNYAFASNGSTQINSMSCLIIDSHTYTFEDKSKNLKHHNWMGTPKKGNLINLEFKITNSGQMAVGFDHPALAALTHFTDFEKIETDSKKWVKSEDMTLKLTNLRMHRSGLQMLSKNSRKSIDLRLLSGSDWGGFIIEDIIGDVESNSIQIISLNCRQTPEKWNNMLDLIINKAMR